MAAVSVQEFSPCPITWGSGHEPTGTNAWSFLTRQESICSTAKGGMWVPPLMRCWLQSTWPLQLLLEVQALHRVSQTWSGASSARGRSWNLGEKWGGIPQRLSEPLTVCAQYSSCSALEVDFFIDWPTAYKGTRPHIQLHRDNAVLRVGTKIQL